MFKHTIPSFKSCSLHPKHFKLISAQQRKPSQFGFCGGHKSGFLDLIAQLAVPNTLKIYFEIFLGCHNSPLWTLFETVVAATCVVPVVSVVSLATSKGFIELKITFLRKYTDKIYFIAKPGRQG